MPTRGRAFIVMPFGRKDAPDGTVVDFDQVYGRLLKPAVEAAGLQPHRADAERRGGSIHADMFQELLLAEFVVADLTIDNPNVWYEIGVRHALRATGETNSRTVTTHRFPVAATTTPRGVPVYSAAGASRSHPTSMRS